VDLKKTVKKEEETNTNGKLCIEWDEEQGSSVPPYSPPRRRVV
jgi:hypothetical protein